MSYHIEVRPVDIEEDYVLLELCITTPDGHFLGQSVRLKNMERAFLSLGLESEEEAVQRGELKGCSLCLRETMIDLKEHQEAQIARQCAADANRVESLHASLEYFMAEGDNESVASYAMQISLSAEKIARSASYLATRTD